METVLRGTPSSHSRCVSPTVPSHALWEWDPCVEGEVVGPLIYWRLLLCAGHYFKRVIHLLSMSVHPVSCSPAKVGPAYLLTFPTTNPRFPERGDTVWSCECYVSKKTKGNPTFTGVGWGVWGVAVTARR